MCPVHSVGNEIGVMNIFVVSIFIFVKVLLSIFVFDYSLSVNERPKEKRKIEDRAGPGRPCSTRETGNMERRDQTR